MLKTFISFKFLFWTALRRTPQDESVLVDIAKNDENVSIPVKKINDQSVLVDIAKNNNDYNIRIEAVEKINNISVLEYIAKHDPYSYDEGIWKSVGTSDTWTYQGEKLIYPVREAAKNRLKEVK